MNPLLDPVLIITTMRKATTPATQREFPFKTGSRATQRPITSPFRTNEDLVPVAETGKRS